jgi:Arm DNA-binding domain
VGSEDAQGIELHSLGNRPSRFATVAKSPNNSAMQYGLRFATRAKIVECFLWSGEIPPLPPVLCSPLFAFVRNPQQSQGFVPDRSRNWSYRYWIDGKERWHGLGSLQDVSLKEARIKRDTARQDVRAGVDIVQAKRSAREEAKAVAAATTAPTFQQCAERYIEDNWSKWSEKHRAQWPSSLKAYAYPTIGGLTIAEIKPSHIFDLLRPIWVAKRETANRVRGRIETVIAKRGARRA